MLASVGRGAQCVNCVGFGTALVATGHGSVYAQSMNMMTARDASEKLDRLVEETANAQEPVLITGDRSNAVLVGENVWNAIQETLYLLSIPGMRESIREGLQTPVGACEEEPGW